MVKHLFLPFEAARFCIDQPAHVALALMTHDHAPDLMRCVQAGGIWRNPHTNIPGPNHVTAFIDSALADTAKGVARAFVIRWQGAVNDDNPTGIVGCTRFFHLNTQHRRVQIGGTWLAAQARRTGVNRAVKWLLLREAFDVMGLQRVEFAVHPDNTESRTAMLRLGAGFEGVLRDHLYINNQTRDTAMYSVIRSDWANRMQGQTK